MLCGLTRATNVLPLELERLSRTSWTDCSWTRTASAEVTQPEHARQSVREICADCLLVAVAESSVVTSYAEEGGGAGRDSTGLMQATPGEMKSFRSEALRMALMVCKWWMLDPADVERLWRGTCDARLHTYTRGAWGDFYSYIMLVANASVISNR